MARTSWCCLGFLLILAVQAGAQTASPALPEHLTIGQHTFIDVGPPNDFYEIIQVDQTSKGLEIQRVSVTPPGMACVQPAKVEYASGVLHETMSALLKGQNPCSIPAKALRHERKRCKHCMVFSGADVTLQFQCGETQRRIDTDVLDRDWFAANPGTPRYTSWTMDVLQQLDSVLGPGPLDQPMFPTGTSTPPPVPEEPLIVQVRAGTFDELFGTDSFGNPVRVSRIALDAEKPVPRPTIEIEAVGPAKPLTTELPNYPPIARLARVEGLVRATFQIDRDGLAQHITFPDRKLPMLWPTVTAALSKWKFPPSVAGKGGSVSILFKSNCNLADWPTAATD